MNQSEVSFPSGKDSTNATQRNEQRLQEHHHRMTESTPQCSSQSANPPTTTLTIDSQSNIPNHPASQEVIIPKLILSKGFGRSVIQRQRELPTSGLHSSWSTKRSRETRVRVVIGSGTPYEALPRRKRTAIPQGQSQTLDTMNEE